MTWIQHDHLKELQLRMKETWFKEFADAATIMVPAQVQQSPARSIVLPLPKTNPVPEVATTSILQQRCKPETKETTVVKMNFGAEVCATIKKENQ